MNLLLLIGAVFGLTSVVMGAYIDHGLTGVLTAKALHSVISAQHYHQFYALVITVLALVNRSQRFVVFAGWGFVIGLCLFSFGIYLGVLLDSSLVMHLAPIGGSTLMLGWVLLIVAAFRFK